eukprot:TRINITY_DN4078_c0_g1_i1.p1 TRINITY_DN4078_c0_g1~~TRINITY_DN4078_c0_g1_i1.p1  ORF type:complete len:288 (+),score=68.55 TRINITY_DN4078_c0_g1_i1:292-1155(+)
MGVSIDISKPAARKKRQLSIHLHSLPVTFQAAKKAHYSKSSASTVKSNSVYDIGTHQHTNVYLRNLRRLSHSLHMPLLKVLRHLHHTSLLCLCTYSCVLLCHLLGQEDRAAKAAKSQASLEEFSKRAAEMAAAAQARRTPAGQAAAQAALSRHPQQGTKPAPAKPIAAPPPTTTAAPISAQVSLMKLKSAAKGDTKVAPEQRFYVQITTPIAKQPLVMFFNKEWKVGRILDAVCDAAGIQNRNHIAGAKRIALMLAKTGAQLPFDVPLALLADELVQGEMLHLEYIS